MPICEGSAYVHTSYYLQKCTHRRKQCNTSRVIAAIPPAVTFSHSTMGVLGLVRTCMGVVTSLLPLEYAHHDGM